VEDECKMVKSKKSIKYPKRKRQLDHGRSGGKNRREGEKGHAKKMKEEK